MNSLRFFLLALLWPSVSGVSLVVGPVIGRVTDTTARVLIEVDVASTVTMRLHDAQNAQSGVATKDMQPNLAYVFTFSGLTAATRYTVSLDSITLPVTSAFATLPSNPTLATPMRFAFIACNRVWYSNNKVKTSSNGDKDDVWKAYADQVKNWNNAATRVDVAFHLGDQYYSDDWGPAETNSGPHEFDQAVNLIKDRPRSEWDSFIPQIKTIYQNGYRATYNYPATREAYANVPNIMIGDDHEFVDDIGDIDSHNDVNSPERFVIYAVRDLYFMYQWQLYEDVPNVHQQGVPLPTTAWNRDQWTWGEYGFLMIDNRYAKYFHPTPQTSPFLTAPQWAEIDAYLADGGPAQNVKLLIVMAQIPIVLFDQRLSETAVRLSEFANDLEGTWEYKEHQTEQVRLLDSLREWINKNKENRAVTLAGGDMHMGGYSRIEYDEKEVLQQLVVGPVSGDQKGTLANFLVNSANELLDNINDEWEFEHYKWQTRRNIGFLIADASNAKWKSRVEHLVSIEDDGVSEVKLLPPEEDGPPWRINGAPTLAPAFLLVIGVVAMLLC